MNGPDSECDLGAAHGLCTSADYFFYACDH